MGWKIKYLLYLQEPSITEPNDWPDFTCRKKLVGRMGAVMLCLFVHVGFSLLTPYDICICLYVQLCICGIMWFYWLLFVFIF